MKKYTSLLVFLANSLAGFAQNVGIGTTNPTGPLSFANTLGNKLVLWGDGNSNHYGLGVQSQLLQIHSDVSISDIAFGYGSSTAFTETMRIKGNGNVGIGTATPPARLSVSVSGQPLDGTAMSSAFRINAGSLGSSVSNEISIASLGYRSNNNVALGIRGYRHTAGTGWENGSILFSYDVDNTVRAGGNTAFLALNAFGNVGIGNANPNAPLGFAAVGGKKITLYPGTTGDIGFAVAPNRLQIYSDNPNADVAIGYDAAGVFNERFAFKPNGALALMGNTGLPGQVLVSNGNNAAIWSSVNSNLYANTAIVNGSGTLSSNSSSWGNIPGLSYTFTATGNVKALIQFNVAGYNSGCPTCPTVNAYIGMVLDANTPLVHNSVIPYDAFETFSGSHIFQVGPGTHTIKLQGMRTVSSVPVGSNPVVQFGSTPGFSITNMIIQIIPE